MFQVKYERQSMTKSRLKNKTQRQYTNISNTIFRDKSLGLKERGLLTTLISLPDGWEYSIKGLMKIIPKNGKDSIQTAAMNLEKEGYLVRTPIKKANGQFDGYDWEIFDEPQFREPLTVFPSTVNTSTEKLSTEKLSQSNTKESITNKENTNQSINLSSLQVEKIERYNEIIKNNIEYDSLIMRFGLREQALLEEIVSVMLELVVVERDVVRIEKIEYPYQLVKSQFLKLRCYHIECVIRNLMKNKNEKINMKGYMITTLYNASMTTDNSLQSEANYNF